MPNTASAKKRLRQTAVRRDRNRAAKSAIRTSIKKVLTHAEKGEVEQAEGAYKVAARRLDRAGGAGVLHPNTASRYKSRLQRAIKRAKQK